MSPFGLSNMLKPRDQATSELEGLRIETQKNIAQLRDDAAVDWRHIAKLGRQKWPSWKHKHSSQLEALRKEFSEKVGLIKNDTESQMVEIRRPSSSEVA